MSGFTLTAMTNGGGEQHDQIDRQVLVTLAHGYVQLLADEYGVDILHLKGRAVDERLWQRSASGEPGPRYSLDVDVLVRPAHVDRFVAALLAHDWHKVTGFVEGSAFAHAMNLRHRYLGNVDLHRWWPGFGVSAHEAFDRLWDEHLATREIANVRCTVPDLAMQRLVLLLHAGRTGGVAHADYDACWRTASVEERAEVRALAEQFDAQIAFAAAIGELDEHRRKPEYLLWRHFSRGSQNRWDEWAGRWRAARGLRGKAQVVRGFVSINPDLMRERIGHEPTTRDYVAEYGLRVRSAAADIARSVRRRRPTGGGR